MQDLLGMNVGYSLAQLNKPLYDLSFWERLRLPFLEVSLKVPIFRIVHHNANAVLMLERLMILDDVGVLQNFEHFDLKLKRLTSFSTASICFS